MYSEAQYLEDLGRLTQYYCDPDLAETLVKSSTSTVQWIHSKGVTFLPFYGSYSVKKGDRLAQGVILPFVRATFVDADAATGPDRGGFGSTGT